MEPGAGLKLTGTIHDLFLFCELVRHCLQEAKRKLSVTHEQGGLCNGKWQAHRNGIPGVS